MRPNKNLRLALAGIAAMALSACGGSSSSSNAPGRINVRLMDGAATQFKGILLNIQRVELSTADGWKVLGTPNQVYDILQLKNGVTATLVDGETIAAGHYTQMRLVLGQQGNEVVFPDDSKADLVVPSGMQSGVKITCAFDVAPNTTADLFIDVDGEHSVFVHETGNGKYILRPTVRAYDKVVTGSVLGKITAGATALGGVKVYAETLVNGSPTIVTQTTTEADGRYVLGLLPLAGGPYYVVSQPVVGGISYAAKATPAITLTATSPTPTYDLGFDVATTGTLTGTVTQPAGENQADVVSIATPLDTGAVTKTDLIVREETASGSPTETYEAALLPVGDYTAWATRTTVDPVTHDVLSTSVGTVGAVTTVNAGQSATLNLTVP